MSDWLAMGGHGFYIWSSYGMLALAVALELAALRWRRKAAWQHVDDLRDEFDPGAQAPAAAPHSIPTEPA